MLKKFDKKIDDLNFRLLRNKLIDVSELVGGRYELLKRNFISGIFKGMGIGIGVTVVTALIIIVLQRIVKLNIPVIGEYITDIVEIVEKNR